MFFWAEPVLWGYGSTQAPLLGACKCSGRGHSREEFEGGEGNGLTALFGDHTQHPTPHWKKQEDIGRWELCKSALPLNTSLCYLGISRVQERNHTDLGTYPPDGGRREGVRQRTLSPQKRAKPACLASSTCWMPVRMLATWLGFCRFGKEGFQGREQSQGATAFLPSPPLAPFPVEVRVGINTHGTGAVPTPQEENNIFSSYMILVCSYVTRYLMTVKYCIVLILKMRTSLEDRSHFSKCFLNATFTNTFIFLLLLTCSLTF